MMFTNLDTHTHAHARAHTHTHTKDWDNLLYIGITLDELKTS